MTEVWENTFIEKGAMWGFEPSESAIIANNFFIEKGVKDILIPGIGYGRNAKLFRDSGINVTGIEISKTAIDLARTYYGTQMKIYEGSVTHMPFDNHLYDGIFCYGLIYLLNSEERRKLIEDCYNQLQPKGYMVFSVISKNSPNYGMGKQVGQDCFELAEGVRLYFYNAQSVRGEFKNFGLHEFTEIDEPIKNMANKLPFKFLLITCRKEI